MRSWQIALGEVLAPAAVLTGVQWALVLVALTLRLQTHEANLRPGESFDTVDAGWQRRALANPKASIQTTLASMLPASVAAAILRQLAIDGGGALAHMPRDDRRRLARSLVEWPLPVAGSRGYTYAEATAGGVSLAEIDAGTMASRTCPGLSCVGEILDVDGRIGGFNFQWAWSSGFVAGRALAAI